MARSPELCLVENSGLKMYFPVWCRTELIFCKCVFGYTCKTTPCLPWNTLTVRCLEACSEVWDGWILIPHLLKWRRKKRSWAFTFSESPGLFCYYPILGVFLRNSKKNAFAWGNFFTKVNALLGRIFIWIKDFKSCVHACVKVPLCSSRVCTHSALC